MRQGSYGEVDGVEVIGWLGIADRLGFRTRSGAVAEQTARTLPARVRTFPRPVYTVPGEGCLEYVLFDWRAVREVAIQTGRLAPDGVTARRLRPRRGRAKKPRSKVKV